VGVCFSDAAALCHFVWGEWPGVLFRPGSKYCGSVFADSCIRPATVSAFALCDDDAGLLEQTFRLAAQHSRWHPQRRSTPAAGASRKGRGRNGRRRDRKPSSHGLPLRRSADHTDGVHRLAAPVGMEELARDFARGANMDPVVASVDTEGSFVHVQGRHGQELCDRRRFPSLQSLVQLHDVFEKGCLGDELSDQGEDQLLNRLREDHLSDEQMERIGF